MRYALEQAVSITGALFVLGAFAAQRFRLLSADGWAYLLLNFFGGAMLCAVAISSEQLGFILLEGAWAIISLWGLYRLLRAG